MTKDAFEITQADSDPFGLRRFDFRTRVPEKSEMFEPEEAQAYIEGCDYPETVDDFLLALEAEKLFGNNRLKQMRVLDAMCGPGRLGREFLALGTQHVAFHDGDNVMLSHATKKAFATMQSGQNIGFVQSPIEKISLPDNTFDLVICHNSTHQMASIERLREAMAEFVRITAPGGQIIIADYQRSTSPDFFRSLEERLQWTRPEIVPLLIPSFTAAFSKDEFASVVDSIPGITKWSIFDAQPPVLSPELYARVEKDPVKGHLMDFSPISQRVIIQKA